MRQLALIELGRRKHQKEKHFERPKKVLAQFFTPAFLASWMVEFGASFTESREAALDPACGDGAFLQPLLAAGFRRVVGVDVDEKVLRDCERRCGHHENLRLLHANALNLLPELEGQFDLVATNPPFSAKYGRVTEAGLLRRYELGQGRKSEAAEVLFLELCVRALRGGGMLAVVLPEGIFANLPQRRVREWLVRHATPIAIVSLSRSFFAAKSCVLFARKGPAPPGATVLLAHAETEKELQEIEQRSVRKAVAEMLDDMSPLHHLLQSDLRSFFPLRPLKDLLQEMRGGSSEYGRRRRFVGSGIPFISARTVTPFGMDLKRDGRFVAQGSPMDKPQARTKVGDVVFVRVGVGCIGRAAVVLHEDETGVANDYLYILRFHQEQMLPEFFALLTQTRFFKQQLDRCKRGTGTVTIPQKLLGEILVPAPPIGLQQHFARAYRELHERYRKGLAAADELAALIDELEKAMGGGVNQGRTASPCIPPANGTSFPQKVRRGGGTSSPCISRSVNAV